MALRTLMMPRTAIAGMPAAEPAVYTICIRLLMGQGPCQRPLHMLHNGAWSAKHAHSGRVDGDGGDAGVFGVPGLPESTIRPAFDATSLD